MSLKFWYIDINQKISILWKKSISYAKLAGLFSRVEPSGAETGILRDDLVNTMVADVLAPCVARPSAAMALIMQDNQTVSFHGVAFYQPVQVHW